MYQTIVDNVAEREADVVTPSEHQGSGPYPQRLRDFSKALAIDLYRRSQAIVSAESIGAVAARLGIDRLTAQSRSFLSRDRETDVFHFSHNSFKDYFLAVALFDRELREEDFDWKNYPETNRFYTEMCWKRYAKREVPVTAERQPLDLGDRAALHAHSDLVTLMPNRALRALLIREEKALVTAFPDNALPLWGDLLDWLKSRCTDAERGHYAFADWEAARRALREQAPETPENTLYEELCLVEHLYRMVTQHWGGLLTTKSTTWALAPPPAPPAYANLLSPAYPEADFGRVLERLLGYNPRLAAAFDRLEHLSLRGLGIQSLDFLHHQQIRRNLRSLDLRDNLLADTDDLKALLYWPELRELRLDDNPLPTDLQPAAAAPDCLRALREQLLLPPLMMPVTGGTFKMGQPDRNAYRYQFKDGSVRDASNEQPVHAVTLSDFELSPYAVTLGEFRQFIDATGYQTIAERDNRGSYMYNPDTDDWDETPGIHWRHDAQGKVQNNDRHPVLHVSWYDAVQYCNWLSKKTGRLSAYTIDEDAPDQNNLHEDDPFRWTVRLRTSAAANGYRLPTEAEWEYAAREKGRDVRFGNGKNIADPKEINFDGSPQYKYEYSVAGIFRGGTVPVGSLDCPNALGLYDMSGNVLEWCWDWYDRYPEAHQTDPTGPTSGSYRVLRGGSWSYDPQYARTAYRSYGWPFWRDAGTGFRLARTL